MNARRTVWCSHTGGGVEAGNIHDGTRIIRRHRFWTTSTEGKLMSTGASSRASVSLVRQLNDVTCFYVEDALVNCTVAITHDGVHCAASADRMAHKLKRRFSAGASYRSNQSRYNLWTKTTKPLNYTPSAPVTRMADFYTTGGHITRSTALHAAIK